MTHHPRRVAVVGAGLAGLGTCRALRDQGYAGGITLFGDEEVPPYDDRRYRRRSCSASSTTRLCRSTSPPMPSRFAGGADREPRRTGRRCGRAGRRLATDRAARRPDAAHRRRRVGAARRHDRRGQGDRGGRRLDRRRGCDRGRQRHCQVEVFEALAAPRRRRCPPRSAADHPVVRGGRHGAAPRRTGRRDRAARRRPRDRRGRVRPDTRWLEGLLDQDESGGVVVDERLRRHARACGRSATARPGGRRATSVDCGSSTGTSRARPGRGRRLGARRGSDAGAAKRSRGDPTTGTRRRAGPRPGALRLVRPVRRRLALPAGATRPRRWCSAETRRVTRPGLCCG